MKIKALNSTCEWCGEKKDEKDLELHHIDWNDNKSAYINILHSREHKAGYSCEGTRLICKACHIKIHSNSQEAKQKGFKRASK